MQISLFSKPYKYIIDSSSIMSQKPKEAQRRNVYKSQWDFIDNAIKEQKIVTCEEIYSEQKDKIIIDWMNSTQIVVLKTDYDIQDIVRNIVNKFPKMLNCCNNIGSSSGDAFLIATAIKYDLTVITEESKKKKYGIPDICKCCGINAINITELCEEEKLSF